MKKQLLVLGCAALAAVGAACSSDPALETAVISPMEEPSAQVQQRFANEIRTLPRTVKELILERIYLFQQRPL